MATVNPKRIPLITTANLALRLTEPHLTEADKELIGTELLTRKEVELSHLIVLTKALPNFQGAQVVAKALDQVTELKYKTDQLKPLLALFGPSAVAFWNYFVATQPRRTDFYEVFLDVEALRVLCAEILLKSSRLPLEWLVQITSLTSEESIQRTGFQQIMYGNYTESDQAALTQALQQLIRDERIPTGIRIESMHFLFSVGMPTADDLVYIIRLNDPEAIVTQDKALSRFLQDYADVCQLLTIRQNSLSR